MTRLLARLRDFGSGGLPAYVQTWSQRTAEQIEAQFASIQDQLTEILAAQASATAAARESARIGSYTVPTSVLSAADAGDGTATISIGDHRRVYPVRGIVDVPDNDISGVANVTGAALGTTYYPYYDDTTLANTTPVVQLTTDAKVAQSGFAPGRHPLGIVTTPTAGNPPTSGTGPTPGGFDRQVGGELA